MHRHARIDTAGGAVEYLGTRSLSLQIKGVTSLTSLAVQDLSITGSDVARRLNGDRSAISQAVQRVSRYPDLIASTKTILSLLELETSQH
jgi:hypothetical protein